MNSTIEKIMSTLDKYENIIIGGHINPDGDTIGACLALALSMNKTGKKPIVLLEEYHQKYKMIPGSEFIYKGEYNNVSGDVFIALDCADAHRLGNALAVFKKTSITINIDHHISNTNFAQSNYVKGNYSSSCELLLELLSRFIPLDASIASAIYAGIVYDTGGFRHSITTSKTHDAVRMLMEYNIPFTEIYNELMYYHTFSEAKIFARALQNMKVDEVHPIAYSYVQEKDFVEYNMSGKNSSGVVEYLINTKGVKASFFACEKIANEIKISFRSQSIDVNEVANKFGGGGHHNASACVINDTMEVAVSKALEAMKEAMSKNA